MPRTSTLATQALIKTAEENNKLSREIKKPSKRETLEAHFVRKCASKLLLLEIKQGFMNIFMLY